MGTIKVTPNTTAIDIAFNLSGSLAGLPAVLEQLPVGDRVGIKTYPEVWEDVDDIGQTWTPSLEGHILELNVPIYNQKAVDKASFTTDVYSLDVVVSYGQAKLQELKNLIPE